MLFMQLCVRLLLEAMAVGSVGYRLGGAGSGRLLTRWNPPRTATPSTLVRRATPLLSFPLRKIDQPHNCGVVVAEGGEGRPSTSTRVRVPRRALRVPRAKGGL